MKAITATPLSLVVDTYATISRADARALVAAGFKARGGYLDRVTPEELEGQLAEGLPFYPIGFAKQFDGAHLAARAEALNLPRSVNVWLDDEGFEADAAPKVIADLNRSCGILSAAGYPGAGYFGSAQLLTSRELSMLAITRYWKGCSQVLDRFGMAAEPSRGFCMWQGRPFNTWINGVQYDVSFVTRDYRDDLPVFVGPD